MTETVHMTSVARALWPDGRWRTARKAHRCANQLSHNHPCAGSKDMVEVELVPAIVAGDRYYDTGELTGSRYRQTMKLCARCALRLALVGE